MNISNQTNLSEKLTAIQRIELRVLLSRFAERLQQKDKYPVPWFVYNERFFNADDSKYKILSGDVELEDVV